jgi:predicted dehydrogenase
VLDLLGADKTSSIVALADLFLDRLNLCREQLRGFGVQVLGSHCFVGFDAYEKLLALPEINYVILATPPHFRPIHLRAAVEAGKHVFLERPVAVDAPGVRSVIESSELARKRGLSLVAGTQRRHRRDYQETIGRLRDGAIGKLLIGRAYWEAGEVWFNGSDPRWSEMEYHCRNWYYFTWLSGDHIVEQHIDNLDIMNWVLDAHPIRARGNGGRQVRTNRLLGQIYDHFAIEYEYPNGARVHSFCRQTDGAEGKIGEHVIGTLGASNCHNLIEIKGVQPWRFAQRFPSGYVQEHVLLIQSIRNAKPVNEARQIAESTLTAIMGREAAYSGQPVEWEQAYHSPRQLAPERYAFDAKPPVLPVAMPGLYRFTA